MLARLEQFVQGRDLLGDLRRGEIVHGVEAQVDAEFAAAAVLELVLDHHGEAGLHGLGHVAVEGGAGDLLEFPLLDRLLLDAGHVAGKVAHHTHDEGQFDFLLGVVRILIGDMNAGRSVTADMTRSGI